MPNPLWTKTRLGYNPYEALSWMQKSIRRGNEYEALYACKDLLNRRGMKPIVDDRLRVILQEDVGPADPLYYAAAWSALQSYLADGKDADLALANAICFMARAAKSRDADWLNAAVKHEQLTKPVRPLPDYAVDHHTSRGRRMGRTDASGGAASYLLDRDATTPEWRKLGEAAFAWANEGHDLDAKPGAEEDQR